MQDEYKIFISEDKRGKFLSVNEDRPDIRKLIKETGFIDTRFYPALYALGFDFDFENFMKGKVGRYNNISIGENANLSLDWNIINGHAFRRSKYYIEPEISQILKQHLLAHYSAPKLGKKFKKMYADFIDNGEEMLSGLYRLSFGYGLTQRPDSQTIHFDFDYKALVEIKSLHPTLFQGKRPMYVGLAPTGRVHLVFATSFAPSRTELNRLDRLISDYEGISGNVDVRTFGRVCRLPYSKYHAGYFDDDYNFCEHESVIEFCNFVESFYKDEVSLRNNTLDLDIFFQQVGVEKEAREVPVLKSTINEAIPQTKTTEDVFKRAERIRTLNKEKENKSQEQGYPDYKVVALHKGKSSSGLSTINKGETQKKLYGGYCYELYRQSGGNKAEYSRLLKEITGTSEALTTDFEGEAERSFEFARNNFKNVEVPEFDPEKQGFGHHVPDVLANCLESWCHRVVDENYTKGKAKWKEQFPAYLKEEIGRKIYSWSKGSKVMLCSGSKELQHDVNRELFSFRSTAKLDEISQEIGFSIKLRDAKQYFIDAFLQEYFYSSSAKRGKKVSYIPGVSSKKYFLKGLSSQNIDKTISIFINFLIYAITLFLRDVDSSPIVNHKRENTSIWSFLILYYYVAFKGSKSTGYCNYYSGLPPPIPVRLTNRIHKLANTGNCCS